MSAIPHAVSQHTELRPWLAAGRWLVAGLAIVQLGLSLYGLLLFDGYARANPFEYELISPNAGWTAEQVQAAQRELGWPATTMAWVNASRGMLGILLTYPVLALLLWRMPHSPFGLYAAFVFALVAPVGGAVLLPVAERAPALQGAFDLAGALGWQLFMILLFFFPDGRAVPRWTRWVAGTWLALIAVQALLQIAAPEALAAEPGSQPWLDALNLAFLALALLALGSQVYRFVRRSNPVQRQQTRLVLYVLVLFIGVVFLSLPIEARPPDPARLGADLLLATAFFLLFGLVFPLVPAAVGLAIFRYRLWDIDIIIRRTLTYAALTALLAMAYFGSVLVLQSVFRALTGQGRSELVTVLSTLAIAALFVPLRSRVQAFIDRRFYRRKYDAAQTLAAFAAAARDEVDLERLSDQLVTVVDETMQPAHVGLWLKPSLASRRERSP